MKKIYLLLLHMGVLFDCSQNNKFDKPLSLGNIESYKVTNIDNTYFQWNGFVESIEIIPMETNEKSLIGNLNGGIVKDNQIYIFDYKQQVLLCFDKTGKFIRKIGERGNGPSEYIELRDFCITNDKVYILDFKKIHSFGRNSGQYITSWNLDSEKNFNPVKFFVYNNDHYFLWCSNPDVWDNTKGDYYRLREIKNGKILSEYFKFAYRSSEDPRFFLCIDNTANLKPVDGEYIIYKLSPDSLFASFSIDFGKYAIAPKKIEELRNKKERNAYFTSNYFKNISNIIETSNYIYFSCVGPETYTYEGLINKKTKKVTFGKWDYTKVPRFFFSDGIYFYGYYVPATLIEKESNGALLNNCFDLSLNKLPSINFDDNLIIVKVLLK